MAMTRAQEYGAAINSSDGTYEAQFDGAAENAKLVYSGGISTHNGRTGPLFKLEADEGGSLRGKLSITAAPGYDWVLIDTSDGIATEQDPL